MKFKTILACAVLGLVIFNGRLNAAVESDVVGYSTVAIDNLGYVMLSLPYADLDSDATGFPIQSITGTLSQHNNTLRADSLLVLDPATQTYTTYYYKTAGWIKNGESTPTTDVIPAGAAVFINKMRTSGEITVAGRVLSDASVEIPLVMGLNLVANPYPVDIKIADISGSLSAHNNKLRSDAIMVLDSATGVYTTYRLKAIGWVKDGETTVTTDTIKACGGFVLNKMMTTGTITFTRPY